MNKQWSHKWLAISLMVSQAVFFTIDTAAIHRLANQVSFWQIGLLRALGGLALVLVLALVGPGRNVFHTANWPMQSLRIMSVVGYGWVMVYSFSVIPFTDATAISYTTVIYVALLAPIMLGELVGLSRYAAAGIGMLGTLCIIKPGFSQLSLAYFGVMIGTSLNAFAVIFARSLRRQGDDAATVMLYVNIALGFSFFPAFWQPLPDPALLPWLIGATITGPLGMWVGIVAMKYADATALAPYQYVRLFMASGVGILWFGEMPDLLTIIGMSFILYACLISDIKGSRNHATHADLGINDHGQKSQG